MLRTREVVTRLAHDLRPDVLHANQFAAACVEIDVPVVLTLHSDVLSWRRWTLSTDQIPPEWCAYAALVRESLARADRVVAVSAFLADQARALYGSRRDIGVIHNGWADKALQPAVQRARATLVGGRAWDAAKNISLAAEAARGWSCEPVYLAGRCENPDSGDCVGVPPPLQALGFLSRTELDAVFRATLIYLSPARYDPFGLLPLQAALQGCALLLSDIPSYRELWDGVAAFFRSDDPADLRREWSRLLDDPDAALRLAERGRQRALERYTAVRMGDTYAELYGSLCTPRGAVAG